MSQPQPLSSKEQSLFRTVVKCYESKQYKKGSCVQEVQETLQLTEHLARRSQVCRAGPSQKSQQWRHAGDESPPHQLPWPVRGGLCPGQGRPEERHEVAHLLACLWSALEICAKLGRSHQSISIRSQARPGKPDDTTRPGFDADPDARLSRLSREQKADVTSEAGPAAELDGDGCCTSPSW